MLLETVLALTLSERIDADAIKALNSLRKLQIVEEKSKIDSHDEFVRAISQTRICISTIQNHSHERKVKVSVSAQLKSLIQHECNTPIRTLDRLVSPFTAKVLRGAYENTRRTLYILLDWFSTTEEFDEHPSR